MDLYQLPGAERRCGCTFGNRLFTLLINACCQSWADVINSHYAALKIESNLTWTSPQTIDKLPLNDGNA